MEQTNSNLIQLRHIIKNELGQQYQLSNVLKFLTNIEDYLSQNNLDFKSINKIMAQMIVAEFEETIGSEDKSVANLSQIQNQTLQELNGISHCLKMSTKEFWELFNQVKLKTNYLISLAVFDEIFPLFKDDFIDTNNNTGEFKDILHFTLEEYPLSPRSLRMIIDKLKDNYFNLDAFTVKNNVMNQTYIDYVINMDNLELLKVLSDNNVMFYDEQFNFNRLGYIINNMTINESNYHVIDQIIDNDPHILNVFDEQYNYPLINLIFKVNADNWQSFVNLLNNHDWYISETGFKKLLYRMIEDNNLLKTYQTKIEKLNIFYTEKHLNVLKSASDAVYEELKSEEQRMQLAQIVEASIPMNS